MKQMHQQKCSQCGRRFTSTRVNADTCSPRCRSAKYRAKRRGTGTTWHDVSIDSRAIATKILKMSSIAYDEISGILERYGSTAAEKAIKAVYAAMLAVYEAMESDQHGN